MPMSVIQYIKFLDNLQECVICGRFRIFCLNIGMIMCFKVPEFSIPRSCLATYNKTSLYFGYYFVLSMIFLLSACNNGSMFIHFIL